jgi:hypothetical protein
MKLALGLVSVVALLSIAGCAGSDGSSVDDPNAGENDDELVATRAAGAFEHLGTSHAAGEIYQLLLKPDKTFTLWLKGEFGCDVYAGFSCPSSWSDGRSGDTDVSGTWKATTKGITLQPTGEGRPSAPIPMTLTITGTKAKVEGTIVPNRRIFADMNIVGLYGKPHTAKESDLSGTWKVTGPNDADGDQPTITGTNVFVGTQYTHTLSFHTDTKTYRDDRSDSRRRKDDGSWSIAGAPDGSGAGVLILEHSLFDAVPIVSLGATKVTFDVNPEAGHRKLTAVKQ